MSTQIKRLYLNKSEFVPITLAEAVVVKTTNIPGLASLGITTLDKVLRTTLGVVGETVSDIDTLQTTVTNINNVLNTKQDKLTAGTGIEITEDGTINARVSFELYKVVTSLPAASAAHSNSIYIVTGTLGIPGNVYIEYLCVRQNDGSYNWEEIGKVLTDTTINLSNYVTKTELTTELTPIKGLISNLTSTVTTITNSMLTAEDVKLSDNLTSVIVSYDIPNDLYDAAVNTDTTDNIVS